MKHYCLLLLLLALTIFVGSNESSTATPDPSTFVKYHGTRRYWTSVDSTGKTYISLNTLKEAVVESVKVFFPKDKNISRILSDITLYSPANDECRADTNKLEFKLEFDGQNFIRGEVKAKINANKVMAYMYAVCNGIIDPDNYASYIIDGQYSIIDDRGRLCFLEGDPFQAYDKDNTKNVMKLEVSGSFKCQVFMILPNYMDVEDEELPADIREPLNETFAAQGEEFWWKSDNDVSLSDGIFFVGRDAVINVTNSTKAVPYFFRIGKNQPYPSLQFKFDPACSNQQYDLHVNLRGNDNCRIRLALIENRIKITTNGVSTEILDATKSPTLVFARGQSKVYMKAGSHLAVAAMGVCQIENPTDVPDDQFVIQVAPSRSYTVCNTAQLLLPAGDVRNEIEVLLDRVKAAKLIAESVSTESSYSTSTAPVKSTYSPSGKTTEVSEAGFEWWWILVGILLFIFVVVVIIGILLCICNRQKQSKSKLNSGQKEGKLHSIPINESVIIPVEEAPPKDKKSKKEKMNGKKEAAEQENGGSKKSSKQSGKERKYHYETSPKNPPNQWQQQSEGEFSQDEQTGDMAAIQKSVTTQKSSDYVSYRK